MKIYITIEGDKSAGISDTEFVLDWVGMYPPSNKEDREDQREMFKSHFGEMFDGKADVYFSDECSECHNLLAQHVDGILPPVCTAKFCPTNTLCKEERSCYDSDEIRDANGRTL